MRIVKLNLRRKDFGFMISHEYKCIFVHLPSTAGTWVERVITGRDWWKLQDSKPRTWFRKRKHLIASQAKKEYAEYWDEYFKFSFVRNPWSRMVSLAKHGMMDVKITNGELDISGYVERFQKDEVTLEFDYRFEDVDNLIKPTHTKNAIYENMIDEELDFIGKFENLGEDFKYILDVIGIETNIKEKPFRDYAHLYSDKVIEQVHDLHKKDIERYDYKFGERRTISTPRTPILDVLECKNIVEDVATEDDIEVVLKDELEESEIEIVTDIKTTGSTTDCDTLICINTCEKDKEHLEHLKNSDFYKKLKENNNIGILEYYRGSDETKFHDAQLHLYGDERYDKLHIKTYEMIQWCIQNLRFNRLVKLDCNFLTYTHVGERTRKKICGIDRVERSIYKRKFVPYVGSNGREFLIRDFNAWSKQKGIETMLDIPYWLKDGTWYYCGKCYRINYEFAKFIATSETCKTIVQQHDVKNEKGYHPFAVEDVMIGRMHEAFLESEE